MTKLKENMPEGAKQVNIPGQESGWIHLDYLVPNIPLNPNPIHVTMSSPEVETHLCRECGFSQGDLQSLNRNLYKTCMIPDGETPPCMILS
ncbi:hypothetical protein GF362_04060 [Candidatus Dojkabacteria bacterium]|nr:hypothetical protein [Candidatus Dojkabacteria bacterium]